VQWKNYLINSIRLARVNQNLLTIPWQLPNQAVICSVSRRGLTTFRLGRAFHAVRDNEPLAGAAAINPLKYRLLAFTIAAGLAGGIGALYVHYLSVMCPEEMTVALTVNLLVIVFLGGVGSLRGVLVGAVLFTALPEVLRLAPTWRLVIYGALLLLVVIRSPGGLESLLRRAGAR